MKDWDIYKFATGKNCTDHRYNVVRIELISPPCVLKLVVRTAVEIHNSSGQLNSVHPQTV